MILASGLAMIYGLRGVMNFGHGALYMLGAYVAYDVTRRTSFWVAVLVAPAALAIAGAGLELVVFRRLRRWSGIEVALVTFGIALIIQRLVVLVWGPTILPVDAPEVLRGAVHLGGLTYPSYRLMLIGVAAALGIALSVWLRVSRLGLYIRAASHDNETSAILGVNVDRVSLVVVALGAGLAGLAGALAAPYLAVQPGMGLAILVSALIVVVIGGLGSIAGAMIAGLGLGLLQALGAAWLPSVSVVLPYAALIAVLLWRPLGIAGKRAG